jgi:hypothetical protein
VSLPKYIDNRISITREAIGHCFEVFDNFKPQITKLLGLEDERDYDFIIDSLYLLEDTQLAKHDFSKHGAIIGDYCTSKVGEAYLRTYGVFNACYLQQQALIIMHKKLSLPIDSKAIQNMRIFDYRTYYASHTVNTDYAEKKRSYILDRYQLMQGRVKGYSSNHLNGTHFVDAVIDELISEWDVILYRLLCAVRDKVLIILSALEDEYGYILEIYKSVSVDDYIPE